MDIEEPTNGLTEFLTYMGALATLNEDILIADRRLEQLESLIERQQREIEGLYARFGYVESVIGQMNLGREYYTQYGGSPAQPPRVWHQTSGNTAESAIDSEAVRRDREQEFIRQYMGQIISGEYSEEQLASMWREFE